MIDPGVGAVAEHRPTCSHTAGPDAREECGRAATVHLTVLMDATKLVALTSCDEHVAIARVAGSLWAEHRFAPGYCSHPDAVWTQDGSECVVPIADAEESPDGR